ncbi:MAG: hypothetical protein V1709_05970 [Planctomycetota bacterium]
MAIADAKFIVSEASDDLNYEILSQTIANLNLIRNGSLEDWSGDTPMQWSKIGTPTEIVRDTGDRDNFGAPYAAKITSAGSGNEGISYTLSKLKASTKYSVYARAKRTTGTAKIWTTGAGTNLSQTTSSTSWATLIGSFITDGTPADVVLKIGSDTDTETVWFDSIMVVEGEAPFAFAPNPADIVAEHNDKSHHQETPLVEQTTEDYTVFIKRYSFEDLKISSAFIPSADVEITKATIKLYQYGGKISNGKYVWLELYNDDGYGKPGNCLGTSTKMPANRVITISISGAWLEYTFIFKRESGLRVSKGTTYHLVINVDYDADTTNYLSTKVRHNQTPNGKLCTYNGSTWTNDNDKDMYFKIYYGTDRTELCLSEVPQGAGALPQVNLDIHDGTVHDVYTKDQENATGDTSYGLRTVTANYVKLGQGFKVGAEKQLTATTLKLQRITSGDESPIGYVWLELYDNYFGTSLPTGNPLMTSGKIHTLNISTTATEYTFVFPKTLEGRLRKDGKMYHIVIAGDYTQSDSKYIAVKGTDGSTDVYTDGQASLYNGSSWAALGNNKDLYFKTYYGETNQLPIDQFDKGAGEIPLANIPNTLTGKDADSIDTYHASATPTANKLLPLDESGNLPMGGGKVTGLAVATANGEAIRYDEYNAHTTNADAHHNQSHGDADHTETYEKTSNKGVANGYAELDADGKVPSSQLPSYVDDVIEVANYAALPGTGETGKIYVTLDDNITYRWSGSAYVEISASLALGETSATAYRGDRGKTAYDHSQITSGNPHGTTKSDVGLGNVTNDEQVKKSGDTMSGDLAMGGNKVTGLAVATANGEAIRYDEYNAHTTNADAHHNQSHGSADHSGNIGTESQITFDNTSGHDHDGSDSKTVDHTNLTNIGTNTHTQIDSHIAASAPHSGHEQTVNKGASSGYCPLNVSTKIDATYGGSASGLATLNASSKVVQDPANATATPTGNKIPIADGNGKLDGWVSYKPGGTDVAVSDGGTGQSTQQAALNALAGATTANRVLRGDGTNISLAQVNLSLDTTGILPYTKGGTGQASLQAAMNALAGGVTANRVLRGNGTNVTLAQVALTTDVTGALPVANGGTGYTVKPVFCVYPSAVQSNIAVGSSITIIFDQELYDVGNKFASNTFTAPVTGKYLMTGLISMQQLDIDATYYALRLITSNRIYYLALFSPAFALDPTWWSAPFSVIVDMDAEDTAYIIILQNGGGVQTDIGSSTSGVMSTYWQGVLIG